VTLVVCTFKFTYNTKVIIFVEVGKSAQQWQLAWMKNASEQS